MMDDLFLGETTSFWLELRHRTEQAPESLQVIALLNEVVQLRGRLSFLESRVKEMHKVIPCDYKN